MHSPPPRRSCQELACLARAEAWRPDISAGRRRGLLPRERTREHSEPGLRTCCALSPCSAQRSVAGLHAPRRGMSERQRSGAVRLTVALSGSSQSSYRAGCRSRDCRSGVCGGTQRNATKSTPAVANESLSTRIRANACVHACACARAHEGVCVHACRRPRRLRARRKALTSLRFGSGTEGDR
jgi:hypothetical protein